MRGKKVFGVILAISISVLGWSFGLPGQARSQETIELKAATFYPVKHRIVMDAFDIYDKEVKKRTNGRVKITWFHASTLVKLSDTYDALRSGIVDFVWMSVADLPHYFPVSYGLGMPFMADSAFHAAQIGYEMAKQMPEMKREWSDFKLLGLCSTDVVNLHLVKKPVETIEDLRGLRIGASSAGSLEIVRPLPCAAQYTKLGDLYIALQRKMLDGISFPNAPLRSFKITDVTQAHTIGNFRVSPYAWTMRKETYEKLPGEMRKVFDGLYPSFTLLCGHTLNNEGLWVMEELKNRGDKFYVLPPEEKARWRKAYQPIFDDWFSNLEAKGLDSKAIYEKMLAISEKCKKSPDDRIDEWWKQGRMGKKVTK